MGTAQINMTNPNRIKEEAVQIFQAEKLEEKAQQEAQRKARELQDAKDRNADALFKLQKPQLEAHARQIHYARFQPLQNILDRFRDPLGTVRDTYFPESKIVVVDHYHGGHRDDRYFDNKYYRGLVMTDDVDKDDIPHKFFGVFALAQEPKDRIFWKFGPYKNTRYRLGILWEDISPEYLDYHQRTFWKSFQARVNSAQTDMEVITPEEDIFNIQKNIDGNIDFSSLQGTGLPLDWIFNKNHPGVICRPNDKRPDSKVIQQIDEVLLKVEVNQLRSADHQKAATK